ncbi:Uncharacterised protein [Pseudomonas fluorescens]|uniref:Uncharacterized protein n=1 Tax=Pseudomonas fluorescens TaxID=294 RepID=A0A3M3XLL9_PSEFL|nr:hypothetical protein ALQ35_200050 [Pseudomonas fluorescens]SQF89554.1 Uncharacterised protein [Pseudomonas fluorescens]
MGFLRARHEHPYRRLIGLHHVVYKQHFAQCINQRLRLHTADADPLRQGRARDGEAGPPKDLFLTVQRKMITVFGDDHLGQQTCRRDALVDDLRRYQCLDQSLAVITDPLATDVLFNREHAGRVVKFLADILTYTLEGAAAFAVSVVRFVMDLRAWKLGRQGGAFRFLLSPSRSWRGLQRLELSFGGRDISVDQVIKQAGLIRA